MVAHERPICSIWQQILYPGTPCAHQADPAQQVQRQNRGGPFVTDVLPIPPFPLRPGPVSSPHRGRHVNSSSVLECFLGAFLGRPGRSPKTVRPAHPPPPTPMSLSLFPCTSKPHPRRSIFLLRASPFPAHTPLPIASSLISPVSVSAQLQLSSAREQHTHTHTLIQLTRTHISSIFLLRAARHGRTGNDLFIVLVAWVSCVHSTDARAQTHTS